MSTTSVPDARGRFGDFGGRYVPETLTRALDQLTDEYAQARNDRDFQREFDELLHLQFGEQVVTSADRHMPHAWPYGDQPRMVEIDRFGHGWRG